MNQCEISPETYAYDLLGNLTRRVTATESGSETNFHLYDGAQCIADMDSTGGVIRSYVWGTGIDNLLAMSVHTGATVKTYYAITDHLGSVHALVDDTGAVVESYKFDAWGRVLGGYDGNGSAISESALGNRYLWQGREYSWTTELYNFRARWYDPITGRWLSKDPIGISGGLNQFVFCGGIPLNCQDPFGLTFTREISDDGQTIISRSGSGEVLIYKNSGGNWVLRSKLEGEMVNQSVAWAAHEGAIGGLYASIDGAIPFADPFRYIYEDECGNIEGVYVFSQIVGGESIVTIFTWGTLRGTAALSARGGSLGRWLSQGRYWRIGNSGTKAQH